MTGNYSAGAGEVNWAAGAYAVKEGGALTPDYGLESLAPEVVQIEFHYFDGSDWLDEWDSSTQGQLPKAVEILLTVRAPGAAEF